MWFRTVLSMLAATTFAGCAPVTDQTTEHADEIVNGRLAQNRANVAKLHIPIASGGAGCTGTLIGTRTVLTAAHCVAGKTGAPTVTFPDLDRSITAAASTAMPEYDSADRTVGGTAHDVAVLTLSEDVAVEPARVATSAPIVGEVVHIVGYGITANHADDFGTLRTGDNQIADVFPGYFSVRYTDATHATSNHGDSGGPSFVTRGGIDYVTGVTSSGTGESSTFFGLIDTTIAFSTRVDSALPFIVANAGGNLYGGDGRYERRPPTVSLAYPRTLRADGPFEVTLHAEDDVRVKSVGLEVDGERVFSNTYTDDDAEVDETVALTLAAGTHDLVATVADGAGNQVRSAKRVTATGELVNPDMGDGTPDPNPDMAEPTVPPAEAHGCSVGAGAAGSTARTLSLLLLALVFLAVPRVRRPR